MNMKTAEKKGRKLDELNSALVAAKAALASAQASLQPRIEAEQARANAVRIAAEKADKAASKAYDESKTVLHAAEDRLFPPGATKQLVEAIKAKVGPQFPHADFVRLANEHKERVMNADPQVVAAKAASDQAWRARDKARNASWAASGVGSELDRLSSKLRGFKERVAELEKEIERLPRRYSAARDRRAAEKQEQLEAAQTEAARALLAGSDFGFPSSEAVTK